ncbi:MAG: hypothetical protein RL514_49 [Verrucomicrobiota bacterium]|jgi:PAS domain S-box-containing protein
MNPPPSTILIVDDEPRGRELLGDLLRPQGYQLHFAASGPEALAAAAAHPPDLILLDVMMPDLDGFEVCRRLRADERLREVPVVMLTALDDRESRLTGLAAGADSFLTKPFDHVELRTRVTTITKLNRYRLLFAERERFAQVVTSAPDGIVVVDAGFVLRLANPAAHQMFGADDVLPLEGDLIFNRVGVEEGALARLKRLLAGEETAAFQFEATGLRPDGGRFPIEASASRFTWEGQPALQLHLRDVTEKRQLEARFLRMQRLQGLGSLAGGVAHDLNNIFAPLLMTLDLLKDTLADKPEARIIQTMIGATRRGSGLVKQILAFARGTAGEKQAVPLRYLMEEVRAILSQTLPSNITVRSQCPAETPPVYADPTHLHQLLMNLGVNARDAMPRGGQLRLAAEVCELDAAQAAQWPGAIPGEWVRLTVSDTGTGMTPEVRARLGEAFFTTKPIGQGTGLGLTTVFSIVKSHGGFWRVESEEGRGTSFHLYLPPAPAITGAAAPDAEQLPHGRGELILVADDEAAILEITRATLACYGYRTVCARDGAEAVALFCRQPDDIKLVLADCQMPFLDGPGVVQALRKVQPTVKCVLVSASLADGSLAVPAGAPVPFLAKPFTSAQLLALLDRELHGG